MYGTSILKKYTEQDNDMESEQNSKYACRALQEIGMLPPFLNCKDETFQSLKTPKRLIIGSKKRSKLSDTLKSKKI